MSRLAVVDLAVALLSGCAAGGLAHLAVRPLPRLAPRLRPYTAVARAALGRGGSVDVPAGRVRRRAVAAGRAVSDLVGRLSGVGCDETLLARLRQAGLLDDVPPAQRVQEFRWKQLSATAAWGTAALAIGLATGMGAAALLGLCALGVVVGATRWPGRLQRALAQRRERLRLELYTVNHLVALQVRAGSGVVQALQRVTRRGSGVLVDELADVLAAHRGGRPLTDALEQAARSTPEPNVARTYRLLANGVAFGADLAGPLRALSDEVRRQRGETLKRAATRRRAAMLVPIIAVLAPVMLLFVAAPLPSLVVGTP